jgi:hypothetical protein
MPIELQEMLQSAKHRAWWYFLTGDELCFYYTIGYAHMWSPDGEEVLTRLRRTMASPKRTLTFFWSPLGLSLVEIPLKGILFDPQYFCSHIFSAIVQNRLSETAEDRRRKMGVHFDTVIRHTVKCVIYYLRAN